MVGGQEAGGGRDPPALFSGYEGDISCTLSCIHLPSHQWCVEVLAPVPVDVTLFRNGVF